MDSALGEVNQVELVVQQVLQATTEAPVWILRLLRGADLQLRQKPNSLAPGLQAWSGAGGSVPPPGCSGGGTPPGSGPFPCVCPR